MSQINDEKETLKTKAKAIEQTKEQIALEGQLAIEGEDGPEIQKRSNEALQLNTDLSIENRKAKEKWREESVKVAEEERAAQKLREKTNETVEKHTTTLGKAAKQVFSYGLAFNGLKKIYRETIQTIRDLDKALT